MSLATLIQTLCKSFAEPQKCYQTYSEIAILGPNVTRTQKSGPDFSKSRFFRVFQPF